MILCGEERILDDGKRAEITIALSSIPTDPDDDDDDESLDTQIGNDFGWR